MKVELPALTVGAEALRRLLFFRTRSISNEVERAWIFRNTINILLRNHGLLTITTKPLKASFTVNVPWTKIVTLPNGFIDVLGPEDTNLYTSFTSDSTLSLSLRSKSGELTIYLDDAVVWKPAYPTLRGRTAFTTLNDVLSVAKAFGYAVAATDSIPHQQVLAGVRNAIKKNTHHKLTPTQILDNLLKLAGLGYGLTPSADDVIAGFAATINALDDAGILRGSRLEINLRKLVSQTNLLSAIIMMELITLNLNEGVDGAVTSFGRGDVEGMLESLIALLSLGHDSGASMGLGFLIAACLASGGDPLLCFNAFVNGAGLGLT